LTFWVKSLALGFFVRIIVKKAQNGANSGIGLDFMTKIDDNNIREDLRIGKIPERDANLNNRARTKANPHESRGRKAAGLKRRTPDVRDAMTAGPLYTVVMKDGTCR
jgi:hypothetical protein